MVDVITEAKLLAIREGSYTIYVFQDKNGDYVMCTRLPNWQTPNVEVGEEGFLQYQIVKAGDKYFNPQLQRETAFNYSNVYFNNFIKKSEATKTEIIL